MNPQLMSADRRRIVLDPRTKLLLLIVINVIMLGGTINGAGIFVRPVLAVIPLVFLLAEHRGKASFTYAAVYAVAAFGEIYAVPHTAGLANLLAVIFSGLITRFVPGFVMGYYTVTTTTVSEFTAAMERMHVTQKIVIPMSVMFRFFPTVVEEAGAVSDSMRMRGLSGKTVWKDPVAALEYRVVPLIVCVVKIGEELSAAALTRGLGGNVKRTNICRIGFRWKDVALACVAVAAAVCTAALPGGAA